MAVGGVQSKVLVGPKVFESSGEITLPQNRQGDHYLLAENGQAWLDDPSAANSTQRSELTPAQLRLKESFLNSIKKECPSITINLNAEQKRLIVQYLRLPDTQALMREDATRAGIDPESSIATWNKIADLLESKEVITYNDIFDIVKKEAMPWYTAFVPKGFFIPESLLPQTLVQVRELGGAALPDRSDTKEGKRRVAVDLFPSNRPAPRHFSFDPLPVDVRVFASKKFAVLIDPATRKPVTEIKPGAKYSLYLKGEMEEGKLYYIAFPNGTKIVVSILDNLQGRIEDKQATYLITKEGIKGINIVIPQKRLIFPQVEIHYPDASVTLLHLDAL